MTRPYRLLLTVAATLAYAGVLNTEAAAQFETRARIDLRNWEFSVAAADFNRDGRLDIATAGNELFILLGNGDGTFQKPTSYASPGDVIVTADFNGDGIPDLALSNLGVNSISVFLGKGDGTFQKPITSTTTTWPNSAMAVADFNGDRKLDLVVVNGAYISILLGNGDGTFQPPIDNNSFVGAHQLAVGDFNNDHKLDVAVVGYSFGFSGYGVLLGNGDGTLQPSMTYSLFDPPGAVASADFNHDGALDLAIGGYLGGGVTVLSGNGDGTFQPGITYPSPTAGPIVVADFNNDGNPDLVIGAGPPAGIDEFLGSGDGTFQLPYLYESGIGGTPTIGDFNGDGRPDAVLLSYFGVVTMLDSGVVKFTPSAPVMFPVQVVNTGSRSETVMLTNTGIDTLLIYSQKVVGDFMVNSSCGGTVGPGGSCVLNVVFQPKSVGNLHGMISLLDSASSKPQIIILSGQSTPLQITPLALDFGQQKVGTTSGAKFTSVTNASAGAVTLQAIQVGGTDNNDFNESNTCGSQIVVGATCTISVEFAPRKTGKRNGNVKFTLIDAPNPPLVILQGTGT